MSRNKKEGPYRHKRSGLLSRRKRGRYGRVLFVRRCQHSVKKTQKALAKKYGKDANPLSVAMNEAISPERVSIGDILFPTVTIPYEVVE